MAPQRRIPGSCIVKEVFNEGGAAEHLANPVSCTQLDFLVGQQDVEQLSDCPVGCGNLNSSASCLMYMRELCAVVWCSAEGACWAPDGWRRAIKAMGRRLRFVRLPGLLCVRCRPFWFSDAPCGPPRMNATMLNSVPWPVLVMIKKASFLNAAECIYSYMDL